MYDKDLTDYYNNRAREYERVYDKPERRDDLTRLEKMVAEFFAGLDVLEIACGTGYWTRFISRAARSITATDVNVSVLDIARVKDYGSCAVRFVRADAYSLDSIEKRFSAAFVGFWWSHVPRKRMEEFVRALHSRLLPGALVAVLDNRYVEGSSTPISRTDAEGNTYQIRTLDDGSRYEVLKNFTSRDDFLKLTEATGKNRKFTELDYYWMGTYRLKEGDK